MTGVAALRIGYRRDMADPRDTEDPPDELSDAPPLDRRPGPDDDPSDPDVQAERPPSELDQD